MSVYTKEEIQEMERMGIELANDATLMTPSEEKLRKLIKDIDLVEQCILNYTKLQEKLVKYISRKYELTSDSNIILKGHNEGYCHQLGAKGCPLCEEYRISSPRCNKCPIAESMSESDCIGTPYRNMIETMVKNASRIVDNDVVMAVNDERMFLCNLKLKLIQQQKFTELNIQINIDKIREFNDKKNAGKIPTGFYKDDRQEKMYAAGEHFKGYYMTDYNEPKDIHVFAVYKYGKINIAIVDETTCKVLYWTNGMCTINATWLRDRCGINVV